MIVSAIANGANVKVVWGNFQTASTDGAVIHMPNLPLEDDAVEDYALGYAVHETGHVVGTDFTVQRTPGLAHSLAGILEDVRIEGERMRTLPGARRWLERLAYRLLKDGKLAKFDADLSVPDKLVCYLLTHLWYEVLDFKGLSEAAAKCRDNLAGSLPPDVFQALEATALKVRHAKDTAEVVALADELMQVLRDKQEQYEQQAQQQQQQEEQQEQQQEQQRQDQQDDAGGQDSSAGEQPQDEQGDDEQGSGAQPQQTESSDERDAPQPQGSDGAQEGGSEESKDQTQSPQGKQPDGGADSDEDDANGGGGQPGDEANDAGDETGNASAQAPADGGDAGAGDEQQGDSGQPQLGAQAQGGDQTTDTSGTAAGGDSQPGSDEETGEKAQGQAQAGQEASAPEPGEQLDPSDVAQTLRQLAQAGEAAEGKDVSEKIAEGLAEKLHEAGHNGSGGFCSAPDVFDLVGVIGSPSLIADVRSQSAAIRARLDEYVQAHTQSRNCNSLAGRRMARDAGLRLVRGDMRVYDKPRVQAQKIDIAFNVMLDLSISMRGRKVQIARQAGLAVAVALEQITGVELAISAFGGPFGTVTRVMRFGEDLRRTAGRFNQLEAASSTPLAEGLMVAHADLLSLDVARRVALVVTDGEPNDGSATVQMIALGEKLGIEHMAIGIGPDATPAQYFALSRNIVDVAELPSALLGMVRDQMFGNRLAA